MPRLRKPRALSRGATLGIAAPGGPVDGERFEAGVELLRRAGFHTHHRRDLLARSGYLAGDDARRADELMELVANPQVDGIVCARGGYGCDRIIHRLDPDAVRAAAKPLVGFSDITALLLWQRRRAGLMGFHGPMLNLGADLDPEALSSLVEQLRLSNVVVDPVLTSTSGFDLLEARGLEVLKERLLPRVHVVTPNLSEAARLTGRSVTDLAEMKEAAREMSKACLRGVALLSDCIDALSKDKYRAIEIADKVEMIEEDIDDLYSVARGHLASLEFDGFSRGSLILLNEFLDAIETVADWCENTVDIIRAIAVREK